MMKRFIGFFIIIFFSIITSGQAQSPSNFNKAKKIANQIFSKNPITLYCGCHYDPSTKRVDLNSCNMQSASDITSANRIQWEHMMPAENFGRQLKCWHEAFCTDGAGVYKGRKCCKKTSAEFRHMEAELYNLWPSVGLVNETRSNFRYTEFSDEIFKRSSFYGCPILIDKSDRKVEPRDEAKGIVARANLLMSKKYGIKLSTSQRRLFEVWNKRYPPTAWEKQWASKVAAVEGYANPYIEQN